MPRAAKSKRVTAPDGSFTVHGKVANGEGSLYREADGWWRATYRLPGVSRPRRVRGRTRDEAIRRRDEAITAAAQAPRTGSVPTTLSSESTIAELARWWLETIAKHRVRASSLGKYEDRVERVVRGLGDVRVGRLRPEHIAVWQSELLGSLSPSTVADTRATFRLIVEEAVSLGLIASNPVERVKPPTVRMKARRALTAAEARSLITACADDRLGAAVALLFVQGWRVSEALGLAWSDVDLDAAVATVSRACVYADGHGMMVGPPKTPGAEGRHLLAPVVVGLLRRRRQAQSEERLAAGDAWRGHIYEGRPLDLIFTNSVGGFVLRQTVAKAVASAARAAGLDPSGLGTHGGRSTTITALYSEEGIDLADVARFVGHASPTTTAGYVRHLGRRPTATAQAANRLLDPTLTREAPTSERSRRKRPE